MAEKLIVKNLYLIQQIQDLNLDFNDLFILECFYNAEEKTYFDMFTIPSIKHFNLSSRFQFLKKAEYLVEDPNDISKIILSLRGKNLVEELLEFSYNRPHLNAMPTIQSSIKVMYSEDEMFEQWWNAFPTTTAWMSDDKKTKFIGSRALKNLKKSDAKKRYLKLLNQGLKHEELIGSLKYEVKTKKLDSIKKDANQMEYFKGMEAYFNSERYMIYLESYKDYPDFVNNDSLKSKAKNVTDI